MLDRVATEALRSGSPERLEASIRDLLTDPEYAQLREDSRDLMVALAPCMTARVASGSTP